MNHEDWLELMRFPIEWTLWGMLPRELRDLQLSGYEPGHEEASEHDRHGAFQWVLKNDPSPETLTQLAKLSWLDPDQKMAGSVRKAIRQQSSCNLSVEKALSIAYVRP